jgi:hypothetical protein
MRWRSEPGKLATINGNGGGVFHPEGSIKFQSFEFLKFINVSAAIVPGYKRNTCEGLQIRNLDIAMSVGGDNLGGLKFPGTLEDGIVVEDVKITGPGTLAEGFHANTCCLYIRGQKNLTIRRVELSNAPIGIYSKHLGYDGSVDYGVGVNVTLDQVYIHDCDRNPAQINGSHWLLSNWLIRACSNSVTFSEANGGPGGDYCTLRNWTCVDSGKPHFGEDTQVEDTSPPGAIGNTVENCIFPDSGPTLEMAIAGASPVSDYNLFGNSAQVYFDGPQYGDTPGTWKDLPTWRADSGQDANSLLGLPTYEGPGTLAAHFKLAAGSLGKGTGKGGVDMGAVIDLPWEHS